MTTTMVSLDGLRELAAFRAEHGCAISLYLDLDPSRVPTAGDTATRVHSLLDIAAKSHGATRPDLAHEVRSGLKADFERLEQFFDGEFDRDGAHGLAVFAAGPDNVWSVLALPASGARHGARRRRLPAGAARAAARARGRRPRRRRRPRAGPRAGAPERPAGADRGPDGGGARQARPGWLVAGAATSGTSRTSRTSTTGPSPRSWRPGSAASAGRASSSSAARRRGPSSRRRSPPRWRMR